MITMYTDGGARGNPGPAAIGVVIHYPNRKKEKIGKYIGVTTNNVAEYTAVLEGLRHLKTKPYCEDIHVFLDSELVQRQLSGVYKVKHPDLRPLFKNIQQEIMTWRRPVVFTHISREYNKEADMIVNNILNEKGF